MPRLTTDPHQLWSDRARQVADVAWQQACARGHDSIRPEHYLIALLDAGLGAGNVPCVAHLVLEYLNVPVDQLRQRVNDALGDSGWPHQHGIPTTPDVWRALKAARVEVGLMSHEHLGTEHLLLGISVEGGSLAAQALNEVHVTPDRVREAIYQVLTTHAYGRRPEPGDSHAVTLPVEIRELDAMIAKLRLDKEQAIDSGDYQTAATIRNEEKQILARRATAVRTWAPQVDVARVVREVEHLRAEVRRLMRILRQQGIDADQEDHTSRPGTQAPE